VEFLLQALLQQLQLEFVQPLELLAQLQVVQQQLLLAEHQHH
jgi:hypothetical protein